VRGGIALSIRPLEQFFGQPCLADAGFTGNQDTLGSSIDSGTPSSL
jgi:hypothetical protein